jgi:hypothetical protein
VCMRPVSRSFDRTFSLPKQAWHPTITWICWKTLYFHSYKNCSLPCSSRKWRNDTL